MSLQELLLFGPVQAIDHGQILKMLSLYAAMKPTRTIERHMVFKAKRPNTQISDAENRPEMQAMAAKLKASLYYIHLVRNITDDKFGSDVYGAPASAPNGTQPTGEKMETDAVNDGFPPETKKETDEVEWSIVFSDTPIAGGKGIVTQRGHATTKIWDDNPVHFMNLWGFEYVREYILEGHLVVHENVNVFLHRFLEFPPKPAPATGHPTSAAQTPYQGLPEWNQLALYDREGNYLMQTQLMLENGQPELVELGTAELLRFKKDWRQFVNLEPGDRLDMDMRVK